MAPTTTTQIEEFNLEEEAKFKCEIKFSNDQANIDLKLQTIKSLLNMGVIKTI